MGCVFFEAVVWMLYGYQFQHVFAETTAKSHTEGTPYWTRVGKSAKVSDMASLWINHMLRRDPECNRSNGSALGDLLKLVKNQLLVVNLPEDSDQYTPGFRSNASDLLEALKAIIQRANVDDHYAFSGTDRSSVGPPPLGTESTPAVVKATPQPGSVVYSSSRSLSLSPLSTGGPVLTTRRQVRYTHAINDEWSYVDDDTFADAIIRQYASEYTTLFPTADMALCSGCVNIGISNSGIVLRRPMADLQMMRNECKLCALLHRIAKSTGIKDTETVVVDRVPAGLIMNGKPDPVLRICRSFGKLFPDAQKHLARCIC
jgi:hypothetical protein